MHHGMCVTHVPWFMLELLTSIFLWSRWWGKLSRHSRCWCNPQFCVSGKSPMQSQILVGLYIPLEEQIQIFQCIWIPIDYHDMIQMHSVPDQNPGSLGGNTVSILQVWCLFLDMYSIGQTNVMVNPLPPSVVWPNTDSTIHLYIRVYGVAVISIFIFSNSVIIAIKWFFFLNSLENKSNGHSA